MTLIVACVNGSLCRQSSSLLLRTIWKPDYMLGSKMSWLQSLLGSESANAKQFPGPSFYCVAGNTKGGSITVPLTSYLTGLESAVWQLTIFVFICKTDLSKPVKQAVNGTVILPPLVFPVWCYARCCYSKCQMLCVIVLSVVTQSVVKPFVIMLNVTVPTNLQQ